MSDKLHYNNFYKHKIDRPFSDLDLSKLRWDQVMQIMQKQALAAKVQLMTKFQGEMKSNRGVNNQMLPPPVPQQQQQQPQSVPNDLLPVHIACDYQDMPFNYSTKMNGNANSNSEESDSSSYCSSRSMSCTPTSSENESESENESDIEIDVEDCSDDNMDNEDYYLMSSSMDNIPLTVIQLEHKLRENLEKS